ncbi:FkbM family methyltransferase [Roseimicrobium gellanilyticum]|uniref:FkbM family methyltransferase n=1 Tax=Roseimicrobium gellanilyticum TaxID=748857 RepID=A0A366HP96_9BACT|nr:FkbM family methyltransferase [Roseimicrobium gellanilyticum]RBP45326.1 FkbM family methyltransferase [Roseimicrobium gellanilyticum]
MTFAEFVYTVILAPRPLKQAANWLLLKIIPKRVKIGSAEICLDPADPVISGAVTFGVYERDELKFFQEHCLPGMVVVDIGANVGIYTALALQLTSPAGTVVSIEPNPHSRAFLEQTIACNVDGTDTSRKRSHICSCAASDREGSASLHLNLGNKGDNRLYASSLSSTEIPITVRPLDSILSDLGIHEVNLVKIDVQGCEPMVIAGGLETIRRSPDVLIVSEFWPEGIKSAGRDALEYLHQLSSLGLALFTLASRGLSPLPVEGFSKLIANLPSRQYTNIVAAKGEPLVRISNAVS